MGVWWSVGCAVAWNTAEVMSGLGALIQITGVLLFIPDTWDLSPKIQIISISEEMWEEDTQHVQREVPTEALIQLKQL